MIAKYNRAPMRDIPSLILRIKKAEEEKKAKEEEEAAKHAEEEGDETESISSFSDIIGIEGVNFGFVVFTCNSLYVQDVSSMVMQVSKGDQVFNVKLQ